MEDDLSQVIQEMTQEMNKSIQSLKSDFFKLRLDKASSALVEKIPVECRHGGVQSKMLLDQVARITTPDMRRIRIAPWDEGLIGEIEKAIFKANLGLTPQNDGKVIHVSVPQMTEERRKELAKQVEQQGEKVKVTLRMHRQKAKDKLKKIEKDHSISLDQVKKMNDQVQKIIDTKIAELDQVVKVKVKEIQTI